ncbi:hypothetical protein NL676_034324 [Syzygium grande]|nr:hypothetical protein NL676_034324 [Syzygium grande]
MAADLESGTTRSIGKRKVPSYGNVRRHIRAEELHRLGIYECSRLRVVEGLDELEFLIELDVYKCPSLTKLLDIRNSKIQDKCQIRVGQCSQWLDSSSEGHIPFKRYKQTVLDRQSMATARNLRQTRCALIRIMLSFDNG